MPAHAARQRVLPVSAAPRFRARTAEEQAAYLANHEANLKTTRTTLADMLGKLSRGEELPPPVNDDDTPALPPGTLPVRRADLAGTGWTRERQRAFITHLADHGCVSHACAAVGLSKQSAYALRRRGGRTMFAFAWDMAIRFARKALLDDVTERAFAGHEVEVRYRGEVVGTRIVHNDRLKMFLLSQKAEPLHPDYDDAALAQLWPAVLDLIDTELPLAPDAAALLEAGLGAGHERKNGNDRSER